LDHQLTTTTTNNEDASHKPHIVDPCHNSKPTQERKKAGQRQKATVMATLIIIIVTSSHPRTLVSRKDLSSFEKRPRPSPFTSSPEVVKDSRLYDYRRRLHHPTSMLLKAPSEIEASPLRPHCRRSLDLIDLIDLIEIKSRPYIYLLYPRF
jgi:hypothetical protein